MCLIDKILLLSHQHGYSTYDDECGISTILKSNFCYYFKILEEGNKSFLSHIQLSLCLADKSHV